MVARAKLRAEFPPFDEIKDEPPDEARDAARWRALLSCERIRVATQTPQRYAQAPDGSLYILMELWSRSEIREQRMSRHLLIEFADKIREEQSE